MLYLELREVEVLVYPFLPVPPLGSGVGGTADQAGVECEPGRDAGQAGQVLGVQRAQGAGLYSEVQGWTVQCSSAW